MNDNTEFLKLPIEKLVLDPHNPRLPKSMGDKTEEQIINFFLSDASLVELMLAIATNGFFEGEQLLVVEEGGKYRVVEGNRRLSAVKLLHSPNIAKHYKSKVDIVVREAKFFPTELPCLKFNDEDEILKYLGYRHITGIKSWKLLEKARYLTQLRNDYFSDLKNSEAAREIAKMIGSRRDYVERILVGYEIYDVIERNNFYGIEGVDDTRFHFNYIADSLSRSHIETFLGIDFEKDNPSKGLETSNLKEWTHWLFDKSLPNKIIGDSEHLNKLNKVLGNPQALNAFRDGATLTKALDYTDAIDKQFKDAVERSLKELEQADNIIHKLDSFYPDLLDDLKAINSIVRKIKAVKDDLEFGNDLE